MTAARCSATLLLSAVADLLVVLAVLVELLGIGCLFLARGGEQGLTGLEIDRHEVEPASGRRVEHCLDGVLTGAADGLDGALRTGPQRRDAEVAARLAYDPAALQRRETLPLLIMNIRSISSAYAAADRLITLAEQDAAEAAAARDEKERTELLAILGITEGARISPSLRSQVRRLEDEQKRRAKRIQSDTLLRSMTEIQTVLRDVLTLQLNSGSALMNEHARDALAEFAARTSAAQTLEHVQALEVVLGRLRTNANARLLIEGFMGRFVH